MARRYRPVRRDQQFLLPPDMGQWLPADHLAWFVISVVEELDVSAFEAPLKTGGAGRAAYDPRMLLALLIYAYACGQRSSRQIERLCCSDVAFRVICAQDVPDHTTIARFRQRHEAAVADLFGQVLRLCARAGLGRVGVVAIDGTKIAANAARDANRDEEWLRAEAARIVAEAGEVDAAEDDLFGPARGDEMPPQWTDPRTRPARIRRALADLDAEAAAAAAEAERQRQQQEPQRRARAAAYQARMHDPDPDPDADADPESAADADPAAAAQARRRAGRPPAGADLVAVAQARLDRELARAEARVADRRAREEQAAARGTTLCGAHPVGVEDSARVRNARARLAQVQAKAEQPPSTPATAVPATRKRNLTDPDSRLMPSREGWVQGYNAQLAVTDDQIIVAAALTQAPGDVESYQPMVHAALAAAEAMAEARDDRATIGIVLADAGYLSEANLTAPGPDRLIALGKRRQLEHDARATPAQGPPPPDASPQQAMGHRLRTEEGITAYRRRGVTVEPVNGHLKDRIGLRRFARRGLAAAASELNFAAAVANLLKIYRAQPATG